MNDGGMAGGGVGRWRGGEIDSEVGRGGGGSNV